MNIDYLLESLDEDGKTEEKFYKVSHNDKGALKEKVRWDWKILKQDPDINLLSISDIDSLLESLDEDGKIEGKFYRVSYNGKGIYVALKEKVGWDWKNVKQDPDINWLPIPDKEYKDSYRSFFTSLGYKSFQAKTMKVISKYLDPKKVKVKEYDGLEGEVIYKDQYQIVINNEEYINEDGAEGNPLVLSENDIYYKWDKWITGESHILFVEGLSGSGKSTLAKKMANEYDAEYVEIDVIAFGIVGQRAVDKDRCNFEYIRRKDPFLWKYMKSKHILPDFLAHLDINDNLELPEKDEEFKRKEIDKYIHWLAFEQKERVVVEGGYVGITITRHSEEYEDFPIIFKGTSLTKSVFRRIVRAGKKGKYYDPIKLFNIIRSEYLNHMVPEVNSSRKTVLTGREDDILTVKEDSNTIMEDTVDAKHNKIFTMNDHVKLRNIMRKWIMDKFRSEPSTVNEGVMKFGTIKKDKDTLHHKAKDTTKVPSGIKDFRDFCSKIKNPFMAMKWFVKNKIKWTPNGGSNDHPFQWPDWLIKQKMGNCFDQTIFMHYYCQQKRLEHKFFLITWISEDGQGTGHAVPLFKKGDYCYIWFYLRPGIGHVAGPFRDWNECKNMMDQYFLFYMNNLFKKPCDVYSSYLSDEDMKNFDKYYGDRKILQSEYIMEGMGKNMRSSHMLKLKAKGFTFPNPVLPVYDAVVYMYKMLLFSNKIVPLWDDEEFEEMKKGKKHIKEETEYDLEMIEEGSDVIDRKYTRSYRSFDEFCKYIKTPQEVMNWYKINKVKWNKPTPTGEFYKKPITWPDDMVKEKEGDCFDHAIFMHYFCDRNNIENHIARFVRYKALRIDSKWYFTHHFVCILKTDAGWVGFEYNSMPHDKPWGYDERNVMKSSLIGPYKTKEEAARFFSYFYDYLFDKFNKTHPIDWEHRERVRCKTIFLNAKVINLIDKVYGDKTFTQEEFYNLVKGEMGDTKYEGQNYESGCFFSDILNSVIVGVNKIRSFREEPDQLTEDAVKLDKQGGYVDKYGNYKIKNSSLYDGMYDDVEEKKWLNKIKFKKLKDDKYSAKPQPVIFFGDEDFRARCEVIVIKDNKVLLDRRKNRAGFGYTFPGGGIDPKEFIITGARRECEEEALIYPKHIQFMNIAYKERFSNPVYNVGCINFVCVAEYGGDFSGNIADKDKDEFVDTAIWEDYRTAKLGEPHKLAIERYLNKG